MRKKKFQEICIIICFVFSAPASASEINNKPVSQLDADCYEVIDSGIKVKYLILSKPYDVVPGPRILLAIANEWVRLNPSAEVYPKTKNLRGISLAEATELFGEPKRESDQSKFFELVIVDSESNKSDNHGVELEARFKDGIIISYRVQGKLIGVRDWVYPNDRQLWGGVEYGKKYTKFVKEWHQKNPGKQFSLSDMPYMKIVGRSKSGNPIFDLPESNQE